MGELITLIIIEHKVNDIITYNHNGETIYLKVIEDLDCKNCFFIQLLVVLILEII